MISRYSTVLVGLSLFGCAPNDVPAVNLAVVPSTTGGPFYSDINVAITGSVADENSELSELSLALSSSIQGELGWTLDVGEDGTVSAAGPLVAGTHELTLVVTDRKDESGEATIEVVVGEPNSAPTCSVTAPAADEVLAPEGAATLTAALDDVDVGGDALIVSWRSDIDGDLGAAPASGGVSTTTATLSTGFHELQVAAVDELGLVCTDSVSVVVGVAPEIAFSPGDPTQFVNDGESVSLEVLVRDEFDSNGELVVAFESDLDGPLSEGLASSEGLAQVTAPELSVGVHTITARVTDTHGLVSTAQAEVTVNGLPSAPVVAISPDPATTIDDLRVEIVSPAVDPEGDDVAYLYAWTRDGVDASNNTAVVGAADTFKTERWEVVVTAVDPYGVGESATASLQVSNTPPVIDVVELGPSDARVADTLTCAVGSATDVDADPLTYTYGWTLDGVALSSTEPTLAGEFSKGEVVSCTVTANDGDDLSAPVDSASVEILNTAPTEPEVSLTPAEPVEGVDDLLCGVEAASVDADGDAISYSVRWEVDAVEWTGSTGTTTLADDTVDAADANLREEWQCFVVANDGDDDSVEGESDVVEILPETEVYNITRVDTINQALTCGTPRFDSIYSCSGDWGLSWTDSRPGSTPSAVTVELFQGVRCGTSSSYATKLNSVSSGSFSTSGGSCSCSPPKAVVTHSLTDFSGYTPGGVNRFTIGGSSCQGMSINPAWGTGVYARVTVVY